MIEARIIGKCSWFGGPHDPTLSRDEGLALVYGSGEFVSSSWLFLPGASRPLARLLNPEQPYLAMRWNYDAASRLELRAMVFRVTNLRTGRAALCVPVDWGPHKRTGRVVDLSPGIFKQLELETDMEVEVLRVK